MDMNEKDRFNFNHSVYTWNCISLIIQFIRGTISSGSGERRQEPSAWVRSAELLKWSEWATWPPHRAGSAVSSVPTCWPFSPSWTCPWTLTRPPSTSSFLRTWDLSGVGLQAAEEAETWEVHRSTCVLRSPRFTSGATPGGGGGVRPRGPGRRLRDCAPARGDAADCGRGFRAVSLRRSRVLRLHRAFLHRAGVFLNVGVVSFYHVGDGSHIFTFTQSSRCGAAVSVFLCTASEPGRPELPEDLPCESGHWRSSLNPGQSEWHRPLNPRQSEWHRPRRRGERTLECAWLWPGRPRLLPTWRKSAAENYSSWITNTNCMREAYISRSSVVVSGLISISIIVGFFFSPEQFPNVFF